MSIKKDEKLNRFIRELREKHRQGFQFDNNGWEEDYDESNSEVLNTTVIQMHKVGKDPFKS